MICPKCAALGFDDRKDVEMEEKALIPHHKTPQLDIIIFQCPDCKNIEVG